MTRTPRLKLPLIEANQAQKHITMNEGLARLDAIAQLAVLSRTVLDAPAASQPEDAYILPDAPIGGAWSGLSAGDIVYRDADDWKSISPAEGWRAFVQDENQLLLWTSGDWRPLEIASTARLGVNTSADAVNKLAVKSDAELLTHDDVTPGSGDARKIINRSDATRTASVVFQTGYAGGAEVGLVEDRFSIKTSPDGAVWNNVFEAQPETGRLGLGGPPSEAGVTITSPDGEVRDADILMTKNGYPNICSLQCYGDASYHSSFLLFERGRGARMSPQSVLAGDFIGGLNFNATLTNGGMARAGRLRFIADADADETGCTGYFEFSTGAAGGEERMRILSNGRIGVGTTTPSTQFHVDGPIRCGQYAVASAPSASEAGAGAMIFVDDEAGGPVLAFSDGAVWRRATDRAAIS